MRIAVFGTGGVGGYFGGRLAHAGEDVTFIARGEHLKAMQASGLKIESGDGDFEIRSVKATSDISEVGPVDLVVVGVKAWQIPDAARAIKPIVTTATTVLPLQNGVDAPTQLAAELGREHVLGGLCKIVSYVVSPGVIRHAGFAQSVTMGELDNQNGERVERIQAAFLRSGVNATIATDIHEALWSKFLFIAPFSGVGSLTGYAAGRIRSTDDMRAMLVQAMQEIFELARARGIQLPEDSVAKAMATVDGLPEEATSSMQRDVGAGRPSELESQNGAVVRMARESMIAVPTHELIYERLKPLELKARNLATDDRG
jgi:2-dehydropantoate 2-reductase